MIRYREIAADDAPFLWAMLYEAVWMEPAQLLALPGVRQYLAGWGRQADSGWVALEPSGTCVGAAWRRLFPPSAPAFGCVAPGVPELALAVADGWRGQGIGTRLRRLLVADVRAEGRPGLSLSVSPDHPAARLNRRLGAAGRTSHC